MPASPLSQSQFRHISGLFDTRTLDRVRSRFVEREAAGWKPKDDQERRRVDIGAAPNNFRLDNSWYEVWNDASEAGLGEFGPFTYVLFPVHIRHVVKDTHLVPWHQDAAYVALMPKRHVAVITCFVPLEPDPAGVSTLEFAHGDYPLLRHEPQDGHGAVIKAPPFSELKRFDLAFGDALLFGDHVPHRTVPGRSGQIDRRSFEFRLTRPEHALPGKDYFDLSTRKFVQTPEAGH
jgi:Phytanoyl-CoA dioxygenase (PhyH)